MRLSDVGAAPRPGAVQQVRVCMVDVAGRRPPKQRRRWLAWLWVESVERAVGMMSRRRKGAGHVICAPVLAAAVIFTLIRIVVMIFTTRVGVSAGGLLELVP